MTSMGNKQRKSFGIRCRYCGTVAESWHRRFRQQAPPGATIGVASCACGKTTVDSSETPGKGRVSVKKSKERER